MFRRKPAPTRNALKLGGKSKDVDSFVDQLKSEGENVSNLAPTQISNAAAPVARAKTSVPTEEYVYSFVLFHSHQNMKLFS